MSKPFVIVAAVVLGVGFSTANFFHFYVNPDLAFHVHNALALLLGVAMILAAYVLLKRGSGSKVFFGLVMLTGLWMTLAHVVKLAVGHCI